MKRKVTLMYRTEDHAGNATITSDRRHAERSGEITRIYRSQKQACPVLVACTIPKGTAPWEISSELDPIDLVNSETKEPTGIAEYQLTDLGKLGEMLLRAYAAGCFWDEQIIVVPRSFVPTQEKSFDAGTAEGGVK